jgi:FKBP-type peptidyl-prolyl cis-trans isomerase SlyD
MKVGRDSMVRFHYDLSDENGQALESSREGDGLAILYGHRNIIRGLDDALFGHESGDRFQVTVPPELGYGMHQPGLKERVSKKHLVSKGKPQVGETVVIKIKGNARQARVLKVGGSVVDVDLNHAMAGQTLVFDIEILEVRPATTEELAHGHAHSPGGHAH